MKKFNLNEKNKTIVLTIIGIITVLIFLGGVSYAYFKIQGATNSQSGVHVETATTDLLNFKFDKDINISVSQSSFGKGAGDARGETQGHATLKATNSKNVESSTQKYNIYFVIENNDFVYTTNDSKAELVMKVTDPNGNLVENVTGLVNTEKGLDITTRTGSFLLASDYDITANRGKTANQDWKVEVTFVNLDSNQSNNSGKAFSGKLYMTKEKLDTYKPAKISNVTTTSTYNSVSANLDVTKGSSEIVKYYYGKQIAKDATTIDKVEFVESTDPNYRFTGLKDNETYKIYSYAVDKNGFKSNVYETEVTTDTYVLASVTNVTHSKTLNSITLNVESKKGTNEVVKYYYSKDNGETYEESNLNTHTFSNLSDTTEYKIKVKVQDTDGRFSTEYYEAISTDTYILPVVASVNAVTKYNQITLTSVGTKGTNEVAKYYYSINNGEFVEDTNTHTFTGLNEKTNYTIKVKVADTKGRMSNVYETSATTDAYVLPTIVNLTTSSTSNSVTINVTGKNGDGTISKYYYSKDGGSNYVESTSNSYTFNNLTSNVTFNIRVYVKDSNGRVSSVSNATETTNYSLANYVKAQYTSQGANNLYLHDNSLTNGAKDNSYRYAGSSEKTNNFVCFGYDSTDGSCPSDNLYRIIGVFGDEVKLIKYDYAKSTLLGTDGDYVRIYNGSGTNKGQNSKTEIGAYHWNNNTQNNTWSESRLNTVNLNKNYINKIDENGTKWSEKISDHTWKVGGNTYSNIADQTAPTAYQNEINSPATNKTVNAKVGLMYVSDYGYAASSSSWSTALNNYNNANVTANNWMYMGLYEWTLAPRTDYSNRAFRVYDTGIVHGNSVSYNSAARPVFYLKSTIGYGGGSGTAAKPILVK
ncbi:hypothetical protein EGR52_06585 [bacterium]|nr:hypothetical protein [bacterium]